MAICEPPPPDFISWQLSLDDANDADQDGIPDFSDDPPPTPATLRVAKVSDRVTIEINGQMGRKFDVEEATSLAEPLTWTFVAGVTLSLDIQSVEVPLSGRNTVFWRLRER